jgi:hypothetical protein
VFIGRERVVSAADRLVADGSPGGVIAVIAEVVLRVCEALDC